LALILQNNNSSRLDLPLFYSVIMRIAWLKYPPGTSKKNDISHTYTATTSVLQLLNSFIYPMTRGMHCTAECPVNDSNFIASYNGIFNRPTCINKVKTDDDEKIRLMPNHYNIRHLMNSSIVQEIFQLYTPLISK